MIESLFEQAAATRVSFYPKEISDYARFLYENKEKGIYVPEGTVEECDWEPKLNDCHKNVDLWCKANPKYTPARGWLYYDLGGEAEFVMFQQHSVLVAPSLQLVDITPRKTEDKYLFLHVSEEDDQYFGKEKYLFNGNLFHFYR